MTLAGHFPTGLLPYVRRLLDKYRVPHFVVDKRERPDDEIPLHQLDRSLRREGPGLRPYQDALARRALALGRGVIDAPPRSGKTSTALAIFDLNPQPTVWLAPTKAIVLQTVRAIERLLPGISVVTLLGTGTVFEKAVKRREAFDAKIVVSTPATAVKLPREFYLTRRMLIADEVHHATILEDSRWSTINQLCESIYYRFGLTGTHFRSDESTEILMHAMLSDVVGKIHVKDLIAEGHLVPADVLFLPIEGPRVYADDFETAYRFGIEHHAERNAWIAWAARHLVAAGRRTIVLVKLIQHGEKLKKLLPEATFVNGEDSDAVEAGIKRFNEGHIPILIGTSVLGEGIDLPAADGLVYAKGGKASVTVTQDFYRVLTASQGKQRGVVVDFADRHHPKLLQHATARGKLYAEHEDFNVDVIGAEQIQNFAARVAK